MITKDWKSRQRRLPIIDDIVDFWPNTPIEELAPGINRGWSRRSLRNREGVREDLCKVCDLSLMISPYDFVLIDGLRTEAEQKAHVDAGRSWTMNSRHLTGHAIDYAVWHQGRIRWETEYYSPVVDAFKKAAFKLGVSITCGADWRSRDMGHVELSWSEYPIE